MVKPQKVDTFNILYTAFLRTPSTFQYLLRVASLLDSVNMWKFWRSRAIFVVFVISLVSLCSFLPFLTKSYQVKLPVEVKEQSLTQGNVNYTLNNTDSEEDEENRKELFIYTSKVNLFLIGNKYREFCHI